MTRIRALLLLEAVGWTVFVLSLTASILSRGRAAEAIFFGNAALLVVTIDSRKRSRRPFLSAKRRLYFLEVSLLVSAAIVLMSVGFLGLVSWSWVSGVYVTFGLLGGSLMLVGIGIPVGEAWLELVRTALKLRFRKPASS